jgi:hypothetical protein
VVGRPGYSIEESQACIKPRQWDTTTLPPSTRFKRSNVQIPTSMGLVFSHFIFLSLVWNQGAMRVFRLPFSHLLPPFLMRPTITVLPVRVIGMAWLGDGRTSQCTHGWAKQHASPDTTSSYCINIILTYRIPLSKILKLGLGGTFGWCETR